MLQPDLAADVLKMAVVNRYRDTPPAVAFIKNVGLKRGAIASTVAHDSHNIIAVGTSDAMLAKAVNALVTSRGGVCYVDEETEAVLPLSIAGLMSELPPERNRRTLCADRRAGQAGRHAAVGAVHDAVVHGAAGDSQAQAERPGAVRRGAISRLSNKQRRHGRESRVAARRYRRGPTRRRFARPA